MPEQARRRNNLQFPPAEQPDIVRAAQKDDFYKRLFNEQCYDLVGRLAGARYSMQKQREVRLLSELVYYSLTTLVGPRQTLGEEYCDILMVKPQGKYMIPPSGMDRVMLLLWHILTPYVLSRLSDRLSPLLLGVGGLGASVAPWITTHLRTIAPKLMRAHLALFYFDGKFYDFSKRMTNIHYIFNGKEDQSRPKYHILGALILIQFAVSFLLYLKDKFGVLRRLNLQIEDLSSNQPIPVDATEQHKQTDEHEHEHDEQSTKEQSKPEQQPDNNQQLLRQSLSNANKCTLCLELRTNTTATLCGHLFCWDCITEWCNNKAECPLCRRPLTLQSLICVYHYL